jgi:iron(III) transport system ATP-binding protein
MLELINVSKQYTRDANAVHNLTLYLESGRLLALFGPSGGGKTTVLRLLAGLETPDSGEIRLDGRCVSGAHGRISPEQRRIGMVFQDYALYPNLTVHANIAQALPNLSARERDRRVTELLVLVGLELMDQRYPRQLSGIQQQRVALARTLAANPKVVLLDDPFATIAAPLRRHVRAEVRRILRAAGVTAILVTHNFEEALGIADEIAVMMHGTIVQCGVPHEIYQHPATRAIATFVGDTHLLPGEAGGSYVRCALGELALIKPLNGPVDVLIRPESLHLNAGGEPNAWIERMSLFGRQRLITVRLPDTTLLDVRTHRRFNAPGDPAVHVGVHGPVIAYPRS